MGKVLDEIGLAYLWKKIKTLVGSTDSAVEWENILNTPQVALKSDITAMYRYKGSKASFAALPTEGNETGDVWNVEATGMNYAWTGDAWDALGETFEIQSIANAEIDSITAEA